MNAREIIVVTLIVGTPLLLLFGLIVLNIARMSKLFTKAAMPDMFEVTHILPCPPVSDLEVMVLNGGVYGAKHFGGEIYLLGQLSDPLFLGLIPIVDLED